jgi:hypothetical protein
MYTDLLPLLVMALGAAMAVGNLAALVRPHEGPGRKASDLERPPLTRTLVYVAIGLIAAIWALASMVN